MAQKVAKNIVLERLKKGDQKVFENLYSLYYEKLCIYLLSFSGDREKVEDAVQDMFMKLWSKRQSLNINTSIKSYLYRSAYNQLMDKYRKQKKNDEMLSSYFYIALMRAIEVDPKIRSEKLKKLDKCINELPSKCKQVFVSSKITGLKHKEISEKLNISMKTIEGHITKAYGLIRVCMHKLISQ